MTLFDACLLVDWSSNSSPKTGRDSIWMGWWTRRADELSGTRNLPTRTKAKDEVLELLLRWTARGDRVLVGFDFGYAYPRGTAAALGLDGPEPWRLLWRLLAVQVKEEGGNRNNRFKVAAGLNKRLGAQVFWGCPSSETCDHLQPRRSVKLPLEIRPGVRIERHRLTEEVLLRQGKKRIQEVWKLFTAGSVGSQTLTGIPVLHEIRHHRDLASISHVWPFETGFTPEPVPASGPFVLHVEIWPGLLDHLDETRTTCRDEAQVRELGKLFRQWDESCVLSKYLDRPEGLKDEQVEICIREEGWILGGTGSGHGAVANGGRSVSVPSPSCTGSRMASGASRGMTNQLPS